MRKSSVWRRGSCSVRKTPAVLAAGGGVVGEEVTTDIPEAGRITFAYVSDPEGNVIELQRWIRE